MNFLIVQECGRKWYRRSSWRGPLFRTFHHGFAVGPIMFIGRKWRS